MPALKKEVRASMEMFDTDGNGTMEFEAGPQTPTLAKTQAR